MKSLKDIVVLLICSLMITGCSDDKDDTPQTPTFEFNSLNWTRDKILLEFNLDSYDGFKVPQALKDLQQAKRITFSDNGWLNCDGWGSGWGCLYISGAGFEAEKYFVDIYQELEDFYTDMPSYGEDSRSFVASMDLSKDTVYLSGIRNNQVWIGMFKSFSREQIGNYSSSNRFNEYNMPFYLDQQNSMSVNAIQVTENTSSYIRLDDYRHNRIYFFKENQFVLAFDRNTKYHNWYEKGTTYVSDGHKSLIMDFSNGSIKEDFKKSIYFEEGQDVVISQNEVLDFGFSYVKFINLRNPVEEAEWTQSLPMYVSKELDTFTTLPISNNRKDNPFKVLYEYHFKDGTKQSYILGLDFFNKCISSCEKQ